MIIALTHSIFKLGLLDFTWKYVQIIPTIWWQDDNNDLDDDDNDDDEDDYNCKSVNFQAMASRFSWK